MFELNRKILCVDDEQNVLDTFKRTLRKDFDLYVAEGGKQAIEMIETDGPFAAILSDMRMPGMDGVHFFGIVSEMAPESTRIMLTGNSDQQTAVDAVNEGHIFRFLTKPCPPETLVGALNAAVEQYRLITAEKHLLESTLNQSLHVLVDVLAIVNPTAFSRSSRVKKMAREIADILKLKRPWEVEFAAMLSQIGCVAVPEEILQKIANGSPLSDKETGLYHQHPQIGHDLIIQIPRLETVAEIIAAQNQRLSDDLANSTHPEEVDAATLGSRILKVVLDFDKLIINGATPRNALKELSERIGWYDHDVLSALEKNIHVSASDYDVVEIGVSDLRPGMFLDRTIMSTRGSTLLPAGQEITLSLILRLANLVEAGIITDKVQVNIPRKPTQPEVTCSQATYASSSDRV